MLGFQFLEEAFVVGIGANYLLVEDRDPLLWIVLEQFFTVGFEVLAVFVEAAKFSLFFLHARVHSFFWAYYPGVEESRDWSAGFRAPAVDLDMGAGKNRTSAQMY